MFLLFFSTHALADLNPDRYWIEWYLRLEVKLLDQSSLSSLIRELLNNVTSQLRQLSRWSPNASSF